MCLGMLSAQWKDLSIGFSIAFDAMCRFLIRDNNRESGECSCRSSWVTVFWDALARQQCAGKQECERGKAICSNELLIRKGHDCASVFAGAIKWKFILFATENKEKPQRSALLTIKSSIEGESGIDQIGIQRDENFTPELRSLQLSGLNKTLNHGNVVNIHQRDCNWAKACGLGHNDFAKLLHLDLKFVFLVTPIGVLHPFVCSGMASLQ